MLKTKKKSFWLKIVLLLSAFMLIIACVINPLLKTFLATQVEKKLVGNFYYGYENLKVDLIKRSISFENVNWSFPRDTSVFSQSGFIKRFEIEGISILSFMGGSNVRINDILFDSLILLKRMERFSNKNPLHENETFDFYSLIKGQIPGVEIKTIRIINGNATWLDPENKKVWGKINKVQLLVNSFTLDSTTTATNSGWFSFGNILLEGVTGELYLADSLHKIQTAKIQLDYQKNRVIIDSVRLIPLFSKSQMSQVRRFETNRFEFIVPRVTISGVDMKRMMVKNELRVQNILIEQLRLTVFRDKNPLRDTHHFPLLPQLALLRTKLNLKIDSVSIRNAFIEYEQLSEKTQKAGNVFFEKMDAELRNITNDSASVRHNTSATLKASTQLMGISKLVVSVVFNLPDPNGDHRVVGTLGKLDLTVMNKVLEPLTAVSVRSGLLDQLYFTMRLNNYVSDGEVTFLYSNLKIDKLNETHLQQQNFDNSIKSLLANAFIIKKSNPSGGRDPRTGIVHFKRDTEKGIFDFWLKSVLDGMRFTVLNANEKK
ncbi:MAG: hypothetical protein JNM78_05005 [Cyclobacteriaceae bacterium]|nr:hypothetical protein [Cyclobacteriaceae bacterium]